MAGEIVAIEICNPSGSPIARFYVTDVKATRTARVIFAPVETGQKSIDHRVIDPIRVKVTGYIEGDMGHGGEDVFSQLNEMFFDTVMKSSSIRARIMYDINGKEFLIENMTTGFNSQTPSWMECELSYVELMQI